MKQQKNKAGCGTFVLSWVIAAVVLGVYFTLINKTGQSTGNIIGASTCIGFLIAIVIMAGKMVLITGRISKQSKIQRKKDKQDGISRYSPLIHVGGLPAPENCKASVVLTPTAVAVNCGGSEYVLSIGKIRNVDFQLDVNETQYLKSSLVRGMAGAAAFGMVGAIVGSAPKTKTKRNVKCYAIITYEDAQGNNKTFLLKDEVANTQVCSRLVDSLRPKINQRINRVDLSSMAQQPVLPRAMQEETEVPQETLSAMRAAYTGQQAVNDMRIIDDSLQIMETTSDIDTFLSRYETAMRGALTLEQAKKAGVPIALAEGFAQSLANAKEKALNGVLYRSFKKELSEIGKLKTESGKLNRINRYQEKLKSMYETEFEFVVDAAYSDIMQKLELLKNRLSNSRNRK